jgi:branched-chain amino acid transport system substrate-binding protein
LIGSIASVLATSVPAQQPNEVTIGITCPLSGANAQIGVDAQHAFNTALDIINTVHDLDLPLAKSEGLQGLGGAKVRLIAADHRSDPGLLRI